MNEAKTRAELIDPKLKENGWGVVEVSKILREYIIAVGRKFAPLIFCKCMLNTGTSANINDS